jgi:hypothetical protein
MNSPHPLNSMVHLSLAPGFSRVSGNGSMFQPFQRLLAAIEKTAEAVEAETALRHPAKAGTCLARWDSSRCDESCRVQRHERGCRASRNLFRPLNAGGFVAARRTPPLNKYKAGC